jgi:hypothetical protein
MKWEAFPLNKTFEDFESYDSNPFFEIIEEGGYITKKKEVKFIKSTTNVVDNNTGELNPVFVRNEKRKYVDNRGFIKFPETGFESIAGLSAAELRLLVFIFKNLKLNKQDIEIKPADLMAFAGYSTRNPVYKSLTGLLNKGFIAKCKDMKHTYFINPYIFYKGSIIENFFTFVFQRNKEGYYDRIEKKKTGGISDEF